ncbi:hypothetical protein BEN48_03090 [Hymenobacter glacialis]|uniref:Uncharacterized protein n=2 Tax=Hymenobacter glacialis TaxID=1908236 RepID=A0A1G1SYS7_9BACT|nr:hypothetical protein BEN48_03090 [Hymenobacter glacialis]
MNVLKHLGYVMGTEAVSTFTKIHPLTYLLFGLVLFNGLLFDYSLLRAIFRNRASLSYALTLLALMAYLGLSGTASAIGYIFDTLLVPVLVLGYLRTLPPDIAARAPHYALVGVLLNSAGAIAERVLSHNFFPLADDLFGDVFRSSSLLGHPLNNALITFVFVMFVLLAELSTARKWSYLLVLLTALLCYGARASLYVSVAAVAGLYLFPLFFSERPYYRRSNKLAVAVLVAFSALGLAYLVLFTPFGERLIDASFYDDSSAGARVEALNLIDFSRPSVFLWARPQERIDYLMYLYDIYIIENFLIVWLLKFGLVFSGLLAAALFFFLRFSSRLVSGPYALLAVGLFFVTAATNNSLASSTSVITLFVILFATPTPRYRFAL